MQIKSGLYLKIVVLGIFLAFCFVLLSAQETKSESSQAQKTQELKHEVSVTLKLIQVFVTDKDGNPVTGLKPENFVVFDNKKLQKISDFEQYKLASPGEKVQPPSEIKDISSHARIYRPEVLLLFRSGQQ